MRGKSAIRKRSVWKSMYEEKDTRGKGCEREKMGIEKIYFTVSNVNMKGKAQNANMVARFHIQ